MEAERARGALKHKVDAALKVLRRAIALYGASSLAFSFNGGKDSTVILHLLRAVIVQCQATVTDDGLGGVHSFFFLREEEFGELIAFVRETDAQYKLNTDFLADGDFKSGLEQYIARTGVKAIVLGTRKGDPNAGDQSVWCPSSEGWPAFMRINPIYDWTYHDVWAFLKDCELPYCSLYNQGYTSLGSRHNTEPNSALRQEDGTFAPAHLLLDGTLERAGRRSKSAQAAPVAAAAAGRASADGAAAAANGGGDGGARGCSSSSDSGGSGAAAPVAEDVDPALGSGNGINGNSNGSTTDAMRRSGSQPVVGPEASEGGPTHTCALVVIGDELLKGKVVDANTPFLCKELRAIGWRVAKVVIVPDDLDAIAAEVRALSSAVEVVVTSGGVGPTCDDVTMQAVAMAFDTPLARHPDFEARMRHLFGPGTTEAHLKMADVPRDGTQLIDYRLDSGELSKFPLVRCHNVFVLPGVPELLRSKWAAVRGVLMQQFFPVQPFHNRVLRLSLWDETRVAGALAAVAQQFADSVSVGSYPMSAPQEDGALLLITLDSKDGAALERACEAMQKLLPDGCVLRVQQDAQALLP